MKKKLSIAVSILSTLLVAASVPFVTSAAAENEILLGDANGDGKVNVTDATNIQQYVAVLTTLNEACQKAADVDGNGIINVADATAIQRYVAGFETGYDIGKPIPSEDNTEPSTEVTDPSEENQDAWKENVGTIKLSNSGITVTGEGIYVESNVVYIVDGGDWEVTGTCDDGMIYVNTGEEKDANDKVKLRLNGMSLTSKSGPAIYFDRCKKSFITIEEGSANFVTDSSNYATDYTDAKAAIQSDDSLEIKGKGTLDVSGNYKHGICSNDDILIENGVINISSVKDGLHANDYITLDGKNIKLTVNAQGDGIESEGYLTINKACLDITAEGKGLNADGYIKLTSGTYVMDTTDDCVNSNAEVTIDDGNYNLASDDEAITGDTINISGGSFELKTIGKGIKATTDINISGGEFTINSTDDSVHSNGNITINDGTFTITSGDDGVHADTTLTVEGGTITVNKSYEGLEANDIIINGGTIYAVAFDDGLNAAGGNDQSSMGGRPGQNQFRPGSSSSNSSITINGGYVYVVASGDGIDSNGSLTFNGGTAIVQGPSNGGNFSIDADGTVAFNGGTVMAVCSSNAMWEDIQGKLGNAAYVKSAGSVSANSVIAVTDSNGNVLSAVKSKLSGNIGVVYFTNGITVSTCKVVTNGSYSGNLDSYGYATGGTVSGGTKSSLTQNSFGGNTPGGRK